MLRLSMTRRCASGSQSLNQSTKRFSSHRRSPATLVAVEQKRSPVCWRQLKMRACLPRNISGEKRPVGGMRLSTVQSRKNGDAGKPGGIVAAKRTIRMPSVSLKHAVYLAKSQAKQDSLRTLYQADMAFLSRQPNATRKPGCPRWDTCLQWRWIVLPGRQG